MSANRKVLMAMSGGVDSSVSAALLLEQGHEVIGAFMKNWSDCNWRADERDAKRVAAKLGIPFATFDFEAEYRQKVVDYLFAEVAEGRTPNPDVMCNKFIKFDRFVREADRLGCAFVATGHYARILDCHPDPEQSEGEGSSETDSIDSSPLDELGAQNDIHIYAGTDKNKDQSYFLWAIPKDVLPRVLFPIGNMTKPHVREKARALGLPVAEKKDSTGICFIGEVDLYAFLRERLPEDPGDVITTNGEVVGKHPGVHFFTIGQRHGLFSGGGVPYYVVEKRPKQKQLVVASNFHPTLFHRELVAGQLNWFVPLRHCEEAEPTACPPEPKGDGGKQSPREDCFGLRPRNDMTARIRYRQPLQKCQIAFPPLPDQRSPEALAKGEGGRGGVEASSVHVVFDDPQRAITPGQSIVFYSGEEMLGGGIIESAQS